MASKVFYHLGAFEESLNYALGAGDLFNVTDESEYVETIIGKCLNTHSARLQLEIMFPFVRHGEKTEGVS